MDSVALALAGLMVLGTDCTDWFMTLRRSSGAAGLGRLIASQPVKEPWEAEKTAEFPRLVALVLLDSLPALSFRGDCLTETGLGAMPPIPTNLAGFSIARGAVSRGIATGALQL
jgi:hypothetical protein